MRGRKQEAPVIDPVRRSEVEGLLRQRTLNPRVRERLEMVKARAFGQDLATIASWGGRTVRTVDCWLRLYLAGGAPALADAPRQGRPRRPMLPIGRRSPARWRRLRGNWAWALTSGRRRAW